MDLGFVIVLGLAIYGASLMVSGISAYLTSAKGEIKALAAAAVASGVVMWAAVLITSPMSYSGGRPSQPEIVVNEQ